MRTTIVILIILSMSYFGFSQNDNKIVLNGINSFNQEQILSKPFPNPVKESTQINYNLPSGIKIGTIVIFNIFGQRG